MSHDSKILPKQFSNIHEMNFKHLDSDTSYESKGKGSGRASS